MSSPSLIEIQATDTVETAAAKITVKPEVIILLLGSFDAAIAPQVRSVCARALAPVALMANALIVDNGASDGLAAQMGQAAQQMDQSPPLLGILDPATESHDPNHTHLLRLPAEWTDSVKSSFLLTAELAKSGATGQKPVIALLFGGSDAHKITVQRCARRGWPILVVQGAGGLGDAILAALSPPADGAPAPAIPDPDLREIIDTASICPLALAGNVDDLQRVLFGPIQKPADVLADAWSRYDDLDLAAVEKQDLFRKIQIAILTLAVAATLLAVAISGKALPEKFRSWLFQRLPSIITQHIHGVLHLLLILVPITISVLVSLNSRFREGNKWVLLRAAAESIKREIFRYRARSGVYSEEQCTQASAQSKLATNIKDITNSLVQSEVNRSSLPHRPANDTSRVGFLMPEDYLLERIKEQTGYFERKTAALYKRLQRLEIYILTAGGLGTLLAALGGEVWVALTTALATAFTTKLEIDQVENTLVQYNVALTSLRNIESWWKALSPWEKTRRRNIDLLVDQTEKTLERETAGWVQQMQSELDKLTEKQPGPDRQSASAQQS
jgi:hypothetical protein